MAEPLRASVPDKTSAAYHWGSTAEERSRPYPCDSLQPNPDDILFRAIGIDAPAPLLFKWLCQLRVAPYSYDWLDNWGRTSPQELTPGLENLARGDRFMSVFSVTSFQPGRQITWEIRGRRPRSLFGQVVGSCSVEALSQRRSRLLTKILVTHPTRFPFSAMRYLLAWGDLLMMRRQFLNLKRLAERDAKKQTNGMRT